MSRILYKRIIIYCLLFILSWNIAFCEMLSLTQSIEIALNRNLNHKYDELELEVSKANVRKARADLYPKFYLTDNISNYSKYKNNKHAYTSSFTMPIYTGGKLSNLVAAANDRTTSKLYILKENELGLEKNVSQAYMSLLQQSRVVKIKLNSIERAREQLKFVENEFKAGRRGKEAVLRWKVLINNYEEDLIDFKNQLENRRINFNSLLELDLSAETGLAPYGSESFDVDYQEIQELKKRYSFNQITDMIYDYTLEMSPAVKRRIVDISAAQHDLKAAEADRRPRFDFAYGYNWLDGNNMDFSNDWNFAIAARVPVFDNTLKENIEISKLRLKQVQVQKDIYNRDLRSLIRRYYANQQSSLEQVILKRQQAEQAKQYLDQINEKYAKGKATDVDLIDAFNSYYNNQFSKMRALYNYYIERENLQALMGYSDFFQTPSITEYVQMKKTGKSITAPLDPSTAGIIDAVTNNSYERVNSMLAQDPALVKARDTSGWTPLHHAIFKGDKKLIELLVSKGADVNSRTNSGMTPIYLAVGEGRKEIAETLINKGADVNICGSTSERFPLQRAAAKGQVAMVELLIKHGAKINCQSRIGWTPLHSAAESGYVDIVKILLDQGADPEIKNASGLTPVDIARDEGQEEVISLLMDKISKKPKVNLKTSSPAKDEKK